MKWDEISNIVLGTGEDNPRRLFEEGEKFFKAGLNISSGRDALELFTKAAACFTEAIEWFEKNVPKPAESIYKLIYANLYIYRGFVYYRVGNGKEAAKDLKKVIEVLEFRKS